MRTSDKIQRNENDMKKEQSPQKTKISLFHYAFCNQLAISQTANSFLEALANSHDKYEVRLHVDVDGGGSVKAEQLNDIKPGLEKITVKHHETNLGRSSISLETLTRTLERTWACISADKPDVLILLEDDVRFFRLSNSWHKQIQSETTYVIGSADDKNKFSPAELLTIKGMTGSEPFMLKWAAAGGTHIRASQFGAIANAIKDLAIEFSHANIPLFFDKLLYGSLNIYEQANISCNLVGDVSQGRLTRMGWRYPVVHGIKDAAQMKAPG
jgi:hypothetical protein